MSPGSKKQNFTNNPQNQTILLLFLGLCAVLFALIGETLLDMYFEGESFLDALLSPTPHEMAIRALFISTLILLLLYITSIWRKRDLLETSLQQALEVARIEKSKSEAILEVVGDAISIQDIDLKVLYQNRAHLDLMGNHLGEKCYFAYQKRATACEGCHLLLSFKDGLPHRREAAAPAKGGTIYVEIISTPLRDSSGKIVAGIESVRNITQRKETEENILKLNAELRKKTQELSALNHDLKAFSYSLSHDLKTPLTIIYGSAQILRDVYASKLDETGSYLLEQIIVAGERMDQLLDAMLRMAHNAQKGMALEEIHLSLIATEIVAAQKSSVPNRSIHYTIADEIICKGDPHLIRSVLENLLGNAWKYTRDTKDPVIEFGSEVRDGVEYYFVRDNGAGFDMEKADKLFLPFQRLHTQEEFEGNGVGLATARQIIHRHGGRIWAEGKKGEGATFYFTL
ncbi:MAG: ATP-binding protein [Desulfuromonadales bacterium]|nr:ATP-binding protein [Desulfuromonadales bacterium]